MGVSAALYVESRERTLQLRRLADSTPIAEIMTRSVFCVTEETQTEAIGAAFLQHGISSAPVVDRARRPLGIICKTDLLRAMARGGTRQFRRAAALVSPELFVLPEDASVSAASALMASESIHRIPIVAASGEVVGMVTSMDIVRWVARATAHGEQGVA